MTQRRGRSRRPGAVATFVGKVAYRYRQWLDPTQDELRRQGVITFGRGTYGDPVVVYHEGDQTKVSVGRYCSIASGVQFMPGGNHRTDWVSSYPFRVRHGMDGAFDDGQPWSKGDIVVGNDVWIGNGAIVLSGVSIGDGAVVAARAVVTKDVEPYTIVAGNPARVVGARFTEEQRWRLRAVRWWDWPESVVLERVASLNGADIEDFLEEYGGD